MVYFLLFISLVFVLSYGIYKWANSTLARKKEIELKRAENKNPYILRHKELKIDNDKHYEKYLEWCLDNNEIPTSKEVFLKEVELKEKELENLINGI